MHRFKTCDHPLNLVPMHPNVNRGDYKQAENRIHFLRKTGPVKLSLSVRRIAQALHNTVLTVAVCVNRLYMLQQISKRYNKASVPSTILCDLNFASHTVTKIGEPRSCGWWTTRCSKRIWTRRRL